MKWIQFLSFVFCMVLMSYPTHSFAQTKSDKPLRNQISIAWENDYFVFLGTDRYYTNGLFVRYDRAMKNANPKVLKKTYTLELGQMIYKQFTRKVWPTVLISNAYPGGVGVIDRPITGYLYGKYSQNIFYKKQQMFQWGASFGTIGTMSRGREVQVNWHKGSGVGDWWDWVWSYQLRSELGGNLHAQYAKSFVKKENSSFQITSKSNVTAGTTFSNASQALVFQYGKFNQMHESNFWNTKVSQKSNANANKKELYVFFSPEVRYQVYDATIQGGMFLKDKGPITKDILPFVFSAKAGIQYATRKTSLGFVVTYITREVKDQFDNHAYGSIQIAQRF